MKDQLVTLGSRAWADFRAFSPGQKAVTIVAGLALIVGGFLFATWHTSPTYAPLYTNLAASDASAIVDKLNQAGVPYKLAAAGTEILVPQSKVYETRLTVSSAGLPSSSQSGYSLLDKEGVTTSEFKQQVDYQRAIEGELAKTIQSMSGVESASVHLAIPQQNVFNDGSQKPTAAVLLSLTAGTVLTTQQVQSIVYLVSSSVPSMSADDVTVTDSKGELLAAPGQGVTGTAGTDSRTQAVEDYNARSAAKLEALLDPIVGNGHAVVTVNADLNFDKTSTTTRKYIYDNQAPPLSEQVTKENYSGGQSNAGTLGAGAPANPATSSNNGKYSKTSTTRDNALGTQTTTSDNAPGSVNKQSIGVLLDSSVKGVNLARVTALLKSASGFDPARGDALSIQAMPFDQSAAKAAAAQEKAAAKAAAAKASRARMMSIVKQGLIVLALIALLTGTWLASRRRRAAPLEPMDDDLGLFAAEPVHEPAPAAPAPQPIIAAEVQEAAARRRALVQLAEEQPKDVASVLSGWLNSKDSDLLNDRGPRTAWSAPASGRGSSR
jgi:flagellar M-ring protein FliF